MVSRQEYVEALAGAIPVNTSSNPKTVSRVCEGSLVDRAVSLRLGGANPRNFKNVLSSSIVVSTLVIDCQRSRKGR